jgi:hypothetical protein
MERERMAAEKSMAGLKSAAKAGGKDLPATTAIDLGDFKTAEGVLDKLGQSFSKNEIGGLAAKASNLLPEFVGRALGTDVAQYNGDALLAMQAVGKIMEGGKLAQGDEAKYKSMLPKVGENPANAERKLTEAKAFLNNLYNGRVNALKGAGYDTGTLGATAVSQGGGDDEAIAWAKANSADPRAAQILALHGGK